MWSEAGFGAQAPSPIFYWKLEIEMQNQPLSAIEIVALDLYFSNLPYVQELAALGPDSVTLSTSNGETVDVSGLAAVVNADWAQFESQIQAYFGFDPSLNDQLLGRVDTVTIQGIDFAVGGWF